MNLNLNRNKEVDRATMLAVSDASHVNEYTIASSLTESHPISMDHNRRLINDIIDSTFNEQKGICEVSSSQCSSLQLQPSEYSYDKRLKYWKDVLREREKIAQKVIKKTHKAQSSVLYNRLVTVDERDKFTVKRLMDLAQRLNPSILSNRQPAILKEKCDSAMATFAAELKETLPQPEMSKNANIEIVGLPKVVQKEMLGKPKLQGSRNPFNWLESKYLGNSIDKTRDDIKRVLDYYPDIENLQIVGESLLGTKVCEHNSEIQVLPCQDISQISIDTQFEGEVHEVQTISKIPSELPDYAFKINDQIFEYSDRRSHRNLNTLTNFSCLPFQTEVKKIFTLQNIGRKVLTFDWVQRSFYPKNSTLLKCSDNEFVFDNLPFRLCRKEVQEIYVMFQPRQVSIVKCKWVLKVQPKFFKYKTEGVVMNLSGFCAAPPEYKTKLEQMQKAVIEKSNKKMMQELTTNLSDLATELQPFECICPYQRSLNRMEQFEQVNLNFKCDRYNDLELLEDLYKRTKKPRDKLWDLQVDTIKNNILNVAAAETRSLLFNELCSILDSMRGKSFDLETKIFDNEERYRTRLLYVRGIISTAIDEWVYLISTVEETFYQSTLQIINPEIAHEFEIHEENNNYSKLLALSEDESEKRQYVVENRVRKLKPYRDAVYMHTYSLFCDFVENIVNVIESTV